MKTLVRFRTSEGEFAVPVEQTREVRPATLLPLPERRKGVAGILQRGDDVITVVTALGEGSHQVLVLDVGEGPFGLLVEEVRGVVGVRDGQFQPPPGGQRGKMVNAVVHVGDDVVLVVDPAELAKQL